VVEGYNPGGDKTSKNSTCWGGARYTNGGKGSQVRLRKKKQREERYYCTRRIQKAVSVTGVTTLKKIKKVMGGKIGLGHCSRGKAHKEIKILKNRKTRVAWTQKKVGKKGKKKEKKHRGVGSHQPKKRIGKGARKHHGPHGTSEVVHILYKMEQKKDKIASLKRSWGEGKKAHTSKK